MGVALGMRPTNSLIHFSGECQIVCFVDRRSSSIGMSRAYLGTIKSG